MHYAEHAPAPALAGRVRYWRLLGSKGAHELEPVPPDGCVELIVHLGDPFVVRDGGRVVVQPRVLVAGPGTRPIELAPSGRSDVIGVRFEAGAGAALFGGDMDALVDRVPALDELAPELARGMAEELADADDWRAVLDRRLGAVLGEPDAEIAAAVARIRAEHGRVALDELARASGLSSRQLERRFRAAVGYGPKLLARIARFQHAWQLAAAHPAASGAAIAARAGYFDQAHLVRDFRQFTGEPPRRFLESVRAERELTGFFGG
jgi:AraC-like DNA-binding protein